MALKQHPIDRGARWLEVAHSLNEELHALALRESHDYEILGETSLHHYSELVLSSRHHLTVNLLAACKRALSRGSLWGVIISASPQKGQRVIPLVEISGGGFTYVQGGSYIRAIVLAAYSLH
jgi:hypothetical protein